MEPSDVNYEDLAGGEDVNLMESVPMADRKVYEVGFLVALKESPLVRAPDGFDVNAVPMRPKERVHANNQHMNSAGRSRFTNFQTAAIGSLGSGEAPMVGMTGSPARRQKFGNNARTEWNPSGRMGSAGKIMPDHRRRQLSARDEDTFGENDPEWLNADGTGGSNSSLPELTGHSVQEFEAWKTQMKIDEYRKAGLPVPEELQSQFNDLQQQPQQQQQQQQQQQPGPANHVNHGPGNIDSFFGIWESPKPPSFDTPLSQSAPKSSKFSRFFSTESPNSGHVEPVPPHQNLQPPPPPPQGGESADKEGFQRILSMLGSSEGVSQPLPVHQQQYHHQEQPGNSNQPHEPHYVPESQPPPVANSNDSFFMSLLNKGELSHKSSPDNTATTNTATTSTPAAAVASPVHDQRRVTSPRDESRPPMPPFPPRGMMPPPPPGMMPPPGVMPPLPPGMFPEGMPPPPPGMMPPPGFPPFFSGPPPPGMMPPPGFGIPMPMSPDGMPPRPPPTHSSPGDQSKSNRQ
ncbi:hypothetical protein TRVA0_038S00804 [Trichomonascus vanleenenianus]|uniref:uncharacterized protein n=1 Tax=Trichomonascus vanleenenianus TaxID=2268995 RepID=UPI003EC9B4EC